MRLIVFRQKESVTTGVITLKSFEYYLSILNFKVNSPCNTSTGAMFISLHESR